jgi:NADH-quinone oxidoreductase subunit L
MAVAMFGLSFGALLAGYLMVPGVDDVISSFLAPTFENSVLFETLHPSVLHAWLGLAVGAIISIAGVYVAWYVYLKRPEIPGILIEKARWLHTFLFNKWYFDEAEDALVYRPVTMAGRFFNRVFEPFVVNGIVNRTVDVVRGFTAATKTLQSGFIRSYALILVAGFAALGLYFLLVSS